MRDQDATHRPRRVRGPAGARRERCQRPDGGEEADADARHRGPTGVDVGVGDAAGRRRCGWAGFDLDGDIDDGPQALLVSLLMHDRPGTPAEAI